MVYKFTDIFETPNLINTFTNILFFIIVQIWFFKNYASQQVDSVLKDKLEIAKIYLNFDIESKKKLINSKKNIDDEYNKYLELKNKGETDEIIFKNHPELKNNIKIIAQKNKKWRIDKNWESIKSKLGPIIIGLSILIFILIVYQVTISKTPWGSIVPIGTNTALFILILGAFTTELLFYFGMVKQYIFYGDHKIIDKSINDIRQHKIFFPKYDLESINFKNSKEKISELDKKLGSDIDELTSKLMKSGDPEDRKTTWNIIYSNKLENGVTLGTNILNNGLSENYNKILNQYNSNKDLLISKYNELKDNLSNLSTDDLNNVQQGSNE